MQDSIIHILEILTALAIWSLFMFFIYMKRSKLSQKSVRKLRLVIKIKTDPVRYWSAEVKGEIKDVNDLRHWDSNIKVARQWGNYSELNYYMTSNNIPGEVMQYPTS